jgi:hypothetical protein
MIQGERPARRRNVQQLHCTCSSRSKENTPRSKLKPGAFGRLFNTAHTHTQLLWKLLNAYAACISLRKLVVNFFDSSPASFFLVIVPKLPALYAKAAHMHTRDHMMVPSSKEKLCDIICSSWRAGGSRFLNFPFGILQRAHKQFNAGERTLGFCFCRENAKDYKCAFFTF